MRSTINAPQGRNFLFQEKPFMQKKSKLEALFQEAKDLDPLVAAIVCPESSVALEGAILAAEQKSIIPILIGDSAKIKKIAQELGKDISGYQLIDATEKEAVSQAVKLAQEGVAQTIVKGSLHTRDFMYGVVQRESGLGTKARMSHCQVIDVPAYKKPLIITDSALNAFPTVTEKKEIIQNAINLAITLGVSQPKVAILSAVENINPRIPTTIESAKLVKMAEGGGITGGIVEGPISFDLAISEEAVKTKNFKSQVSGDADILIVPNIDAGNILIKALDSFAQAIGAGIVLGAKVPIVLTSRSASAFSRAASCMLVKLIEG
jgi:phosphate acetyltransferase